MQKILHCDLNGGALDDILQKERLSRTLLVCDGGFQYLPFGEKIKALPQIVETFSGFSSNPTYESISDGVRAFNRAECESIVAVGGGSALDVAKCIKLFCRMDASRCYLDQEKADTGVPLIAVPTTAGTGSESTRYAVMYYGGVKQSITHGSILPSYALLDPSALRSLPLYQKKCTMLDAICQAIESFWSVNATDESRSYSMKALTELLQNQAAYLAGDQAAAAAVMTAANLAGQAINITQTTAAHAMSYRLTKLFNLPHGHAVAVCLPGVWRRIAHDAEKTIDPRGPEYLQTTLAALARAMGAETTDAAIARFVSLLEQMDIRPPKPDETQLAALAASVNPDRLRNNPVLLTKETLYDLYAHLEEDS